MPSPSVRTMPRIRFMEWDGGTGAPLIVGPVRSFAHAVCLCVRRVQNADGSTPGVDPEQWEARLFARRGEDAVATLHQSGGQIFRSWTGLGQKR